MSAYFSLFKRFILRALWREKLRSAITALGISLGVAVIIAVRMANNSALESFRAATESIAGETSLSIAGAAGRFDELILRDLEWLRDYGRVSPIVEGFAMTEPPPEQKRGEYLQVLGIDVLRDRALRRYKLAGIELNSRDMLLLLVDPHSIILTEKFARPRGLSSGDTITLVTGDRKQRFTIRGLLADDGPARALDGRVVIMDISAAQSAFGRIGFLDRIDVKLRNGLLLESAEADISRRLPAGFSVIRPETSYGQVEKMIAAFHLNLNAMAAVALLVGLFLIYNTVSISVITRREEIGTLRAVGAGRPMILSLFLGEAVLLASVGASAGIIAGSLIAEAAIRATSSTVETFYIASAATQAMAKSALGPGEIAAGLSVALALALVAAAAPAIEASRVSAVEAMGGAARLVRGLSPSGKYIGLAILLITSAYALSLPDPVNGLPVFGFAAALSLIFGGAFLVPGALWAACRAIRLWPRLVEARLAAANLGGAIPRVSISVASLAVSLAMMVAISIMIGSFRDTVSYWVDQVVWADLYARPLARTNTNAEGEISDDAVTAIKSDPQVEQTYPYTSQDLTYKGNLIALGAGDFAIFTTHGRLLFKSPSNARERLRGAVGQDQVAISESFQIRFEKNVGDTVELPTTRGPQPFEIVAVYYDYASSRGTVVMDRTTYERHYHRFRPSSLSIYLVPGADSDAVIERLVRSAGDRFLLVFTTNGALRSEVMRIFDSTFSITYALEIIAIVVAGLGVITTLITLVLERRREISVLRFIGATAKQIRGMVILEAAVIGTVSQIVGLLIGLMLSVVLVYVINVQSFGWTIQFNPSIPFLIQSTVLTILISGIAGIYPAARAARIDAVQFVREE